MKNLNRRTAVMAMGTFLGVQRGFAKAPQPRTGLV